MVTLGHVSTQDGNSGAWSVETFDVSKDQSEMTLLRMAMSGRPGDYIPPGTYKRLSRGAVVVMSNTPMEIRSNRAIVRAARGDVLINGLGLGMVLEAVLAKPDVSSVTVVEKSADVIALVGPTFAREPRVTIVHDDALDYAPPRGRSFDAVWHDIWDYICADNLGDMKRLHRRYGRRSIWQQSWMRDECERLCARG